MKGNTVSIIGNITRDAEVRRSKSGVNVLRFGLAWNQSKPDGNGGYQDFAHYFNVVCYPTDKQLGIVQPRIVKGAKCAIVDGHLDYSQWEKDGERRSAVQIVLDDPISGLLTWKAANNQSTAQNANQQAYVANNGYQQNHIQNAKWEDAGYYDTDIPF